MLGSPVLNFMPKRKNKYSICLIHPIDPRGEKIGGIETYIRNFIEYYPKGWYLLMVGVDEIGDLTDNRINSITLYNRTFDFIPIMKVNDKTIDSVAIKIKDSITFQFFLRIFKNFIRLKKTLISCDCTIDLRRVEFSLFCILARLPYIQMLHGIGQPIGEAESLLKKVNFIHPLFEMLSIKYCKKFFCVNNIIVSRYKSRYVGKSHKIDCVNTWADPKIFKATCFPRSNCIEMSFIGRLESVKDPNLMFSTLKKLLEGGISAKLHYIGTGNPLKFREYRHVRNNVILHGYQNSLGIAEILSKTHIGILFSHFEGMPRSVLETLACGRPVVATQIDVLNDIIIPFKNGLLVEQRSPDVLAKNILLIKEMMDKGNLNHIMISNSVSKYNPVSQLSRVYNAHKLLKDNRRTNEN